MLPIAALIVWLMQTTGTYWWLWAWAAILVFQLLMMLIYPTVIAPLFNKFTPLSDADLKTRIDALLNRCGFASNGVFVMDGSKRSAHGNAYFTGLSKNKRIVFYDTLLSRLDGEQIEAVLAHELGHFKHKHITKRLVWMSILSLGGFALLGWLATQSWFYEQLGVNPILNGSNAVIAILLFMLVVPEFMFPFSPIASLLSRKQEFEADAFAVQTTGAAALKVPWSSYMKTMLQP
jgi:STE24 endopeptidase